MAGAAAASHLIRIDPPGIEGILTVPPDASGAVVFAHGSGSGRHSPRNNHVARGLNAAGFATLLVDLLTEAEERDRGNVFDIGLLTARLARATEWVRANPIAAGLPVGYFGASTGAAAALSAAAADPAIAAVVSRGGRPDLAMDALTEVRAPTLLIVGGLDTTVIALNRAAHERLAAEKQLIIVPGAGHLFEEPGTLDEVVTLATGWFVAHLGGSPADQQ